MDWLGGSFISQKLLEQKVSKPQVQAEGHEASQGQAKTVQAATAPRKEAPDAAASQRVHSQPRSGSLSAKKSARGSRARSTSPKNASRVWLPVGPGGGGKRTLRDASGTTATATASAAAWPATGGASSRPTVEAGVQTACHGLVQCGSSAASTEAGLQPGAATGTSLIALRVALLEVGSSDLVDFYVDERRVPLDFFIGHQAARQGDVHLLVVEPSSQQVVAAHLYDLSISRVRGSAKLASDLLGLRSGHVALLAIQETSHLGDDAVYALRQLGALLPTAEGQLMSGYALIGVKGGAAIAEQRGRRVVAEGFLPWPLAQPPAPERSSKDLKSEAATLTKQEGRAPVSKPTAQAGAVRPVQNHALSSYFEQQHRLLNQLNGSSEGAVAADQLQLFNATVLAQQAELEALRQRVRELEEVQRQSTVEAETKLADCARERDEWKTLALRSRLVKEFQSTVGGRPDAPQPPPLRPPCSAQAAPGFEHSLRQQLRLLEPSSDSRGALREA